MRQFIISITIVALTVWGGTRTYAANGGKPLWVIKGENTLNNKRSNNTYYFKVVKPDGPKLQDLKNNIANELSKEIGQENKKPSGQIVTDIDNDQINFANSKEIIRMRFVNDFKSETFYACLVDDYWEYKNGNYTYYALFAVSVNGKKPIFDEFSTSTNYGVAPVIMSIIPGVGQMYKGSTTKGICMLGGTAALVVGALFCDNERADYKNKMREQPQFAQTYNTKANNYETARNVCLGAAAAVWVYNIFDAALAKGKRRIIVKPASKNYLSIHPIATPSSAGLSLTYNF